MVQEIITDWHHKTEKRCWYIDLEYQGRIWVDFETYKAYKKDDWKESKNRKRSKRCIVFNKNNTLVRCTKKCDECFHYKQGKALSLDYLLNDIHFEFKNNEMSIPMKLQQQELFHQLWKLINDFNEIDRKIMIYVSEDFTEREISSILKISKTTIHTKKIKCFAILKDKLDKYFLN